MFIFYFVYTKHQGLLICNENKEICVANLMMKYIYIYIFFPLKRTLYSEKDMDSFNAEYF